MADEPLTMEEIDALLESNNGPDALGRALRELKWKRTPVRPIKDEGCVCCFSCSCGRELGSRAAFRFCPDCGFPVDWEGK